MSGIAANKKKLIDIYCQALTNLGYKHSLDESGDVDFKVEDIDLDFCAFIDEDHPEFLRICCVAFYFIAARDDKEKIYRACNAANRYVKVSKVYVTESEKSVFAGYEAFVENLSVAEVESAISSAITVNGAAIKRFVQAMQRSE